MHEGKEPDAVSSLKAEDTSSPGSESSEYAGPSTDLVEKKRKRGDERSLAFVEPSAVDTDRADLEREVKRLRDDNAELRKMMENLSKQVRAVQERQDDES